MRPTTRHLAFFLVAFGTLLGAMVWRMGPEILDDGAFFLRYAQNFAAGLPWVWNVGEPPVWGASAPLQPLLLALPLAAGLPAVASAQWLGMVVAAIGLAGLALLLWVRLGPVAGFSLLFFCALDADLTYLPSSGMETPLTLLLLAAAFWVVFAGKRQWVAGLVAGLLAVQKIDLFPAALFLLLAWARRERRAPRVAIIVAGAVATCWYGFAWWYFGSPLPNSFLTKLLLQGGFPRITDRWWFGASVFIVGAHCLWSMFAAIGQVRRWATQAPVLLFAAALIVTHVVAYTVRPPFEPYDWYPVPATLCLAVLAAIGVDSVIAWAPVGTLVRLVGTVLLLAMVAVVGWPTEQRKTVGKWNYLALQERDRADAGRWVQAHTPKSFVVLTGWGNPAFHCARKVIDVSFLNRRFEPGDLGAKYRPEVLILQGEPGSTPQRPVFGMVRTDGYVVARLFDRSFLRGIDYYFAVLVRDDVFSSVTGAGRR